MLQRLKNSARALIHTLGARFLLWILALCVLLAVQLFLYLHSLTPPPAILTVTLSDTHDRTYTAGKTDDPIYFTNGVTSFYQKHT